MPGTATVDDLRCFKIIRQEAGLGVPTMNAIVSGLRFLFVHKIERPDHGRKQVRLNHPRPRPDVLGVEEVIPSLVDRDSRRVAVQRGL